MTIKRVRLKQKSKSMISAPAYVQQLALFGPPLLLQGEDEAAYDELLARMCAAVKPVNVVEEMLIADVVFLEWEILRWRRLKLSLLRRSGHEALEDFLCRTFDDDYRLFDIRDMAKESRARKMAQAHARHEPEAIEEVDELLAANGLTLHDIMAKGLAAKIEEFERIDRLITIAESRRNASLREIDRHRAALGEAVRRNVQEVEDAEFEVVETTRSEGKSAA
jgi:hypothetical protein